MTNIYNIYGRTGFASMIIRSWMLLAVGFLLNVDTFGSSAVPAIRLGVSPTAVDHITSDWLLSEGADGFEFIPRRDIQVTSLGWYDHGGDGFVHEHPVALYQTATKEQIACVTVTSDSFLHSTNHFRYEVLASPVTLKAGESYCIAGWSGRGPLFDGYLTLKANPSTHIRTDASIAFRAYRSVPSSELDFPRYFLDPGNVGAVRFGANFEFVPVSSALELEVTDASSNLEGKVVLRWAFVEGEEYSVAQSSDLHSWQPIKGQIVVNAQKATITIPMSSEPSANLFYRVEASQGRIDMIPFDASVHAPSDADLQGMEQPVDDQDLAILTRALRLFSAPNSWNSQDDGACMDNGLEGKRSLRCALERASEEVLGVYNPQRIAIQEIKVAIQEVKPGVVFSQPIREFNHLTTTDLNDIREVLQRAIIQVRDRLRPAAQLLSYRSKVLLESSSETSANVSIGDVDGDGHLDISLAKGRHWPLNNRILIGDGKGGFTDSYDLSGIPDRTYFGKLHDMDQDGDLDVVVSNDTPDHNRVYLNDGTGSFTPGSLFGETEWMTRNASIADMNGDGLPDIIVANRSLDPRSGGTGGFNYICFNQGDAQFEDECMDFSDYSTTTITPADFNHDGLMDLAVPHRDGGQSHVFLQTRNPSSALSFKMIPFGDDDASVRASQVGDFNLDGRLDIVTIDTIRLEVAIYYQNADFTFSEPTFLGGKTKTPYALLADDLDGDGRTDIIVGFRYNRSTIYFNQGLNGFRRVIFGDRSGAAYGFATGDLNEDGITDIAMARTDAPNILYLGQELP